MNANKTVYDLFLFEKKSKNQTAKDVKLIVKNQKIKPSKSAKYLGIPESENDVPD